MEAPKSMWLVAADRALVAADFVDQKDVICCESRQWGEVWLTLLNVGKKKRSAQVHGLLPTTAGQLWIEQRVGYEEGETKLTVEAIDDSSSMIARHIGSSSMCLVKSKAGRKRSVDDMSEEGKKGAMTEAEKKLQAEYRMLRMRMKINRMKEALAEKEVDPEKKAKEEARRKLDEVSGGCAVSVCVVSTRRRVCALFALCVCAIHLSSVCLAAIN